MFTAYKIVILVKYVHILKLCFSRFNHQMQQMGSMRAGFLGKNVVRQVRKMRLCAQKMNCQWSETIQSADRCMGL